MGRDRSRSRSPRPIKESSHRTSGERELTPRHRGGRDEGEYDHRKRRRSRSRDERHSSSRRHRDRSTSRERDDDRKEKRYVLVSRLYFYILGF